MFDVSGYMFTFPLYAGHKTDKGTYMSGIRLETLALNSDSNRLIVVCFWQKRRRRERLDCTVLE
jgi:hypothetical protein